MIEAIVSRVLAALSDVTRIRQARRAPPPDNQPSGSKKSSLANGLERSFSRNSALRELAEADPTNRYSRELRLPKFLACPELALVAESCEEILAFGIS